ncbi:C-reactive protein-like [Trichomycterus rosablanca]|uniref:C-reactive protein-like n=1 Tax=Trichomycterus rosablanca TaxID=2290929 RepID=UPI002F357030
MLTPVIVLISVLCFTSATEVGLNGKVVLFPSETDSSLVKLFPQKSMALSAFTLCMQVGTELRGEREIILFAYRTNDFDALNVWREKDGTFALYLAGKPVFFHLTPLSTFRTHLCLTWDSSTGLTAFHVNGRRSVRQVFKLGHKIQPGGTVLLGQDPDTYLGKFHKTQSFVGEITDVNMWDFVLSDAQINALYANLNLRVLRGNIFDWSSVQYETRGNVMIVQDD